MEDRQMSTTQRTVDFNKVQWADFWYVQQEGITSRTQPTGHTVRGVSPDGWAAYHPDYPGETMLDRARRLGILDIWTPRCKLTINANKSLHYHGTAAVNIWKAYNAHIYG